MYLLPDDEELLGQCSWPVVRRLSLYRMVYMLYQKLCWKKEAYRS